MKIHSPMRGAALLSCALYISTTTPALAQENEDSGETSEDTEAAEQKTAEQLAEDKKRASARALATEASSDYRMGRFPDAYDNFNRAFKLVGVPALGVWSARSLRQMNHLVEASERYREVLKKGAPDDAPASYQSALADARAELDELLPRIPNLKIVLQNAKSEDVEVTINEEPVDRALVGAKQRLNPGKLHVIATRGDEVFEQDVNLGEGETKEITLPFKPGYKAPPKNENGGTTIIQKGFTPMETAGIVLMSGGGVSLATGIVTTVIALGQQEKLRDECVNGACLPDSHGDVNKFNTMKIVSVGTLIGGAVFGGVGAALYFSGGSKKDERADQGVALYVRGSTVGVMGAF